MPEQSLTRRIVIGLIIAVGVMPLGYFVSIETGMAEASEPAVATIPDSAFDRFVDNVAFGVGEKLTFDVNYGFINAGTATMEVVRLVEWEGRPCYQIVTRARSNSFFSAIYPVEDSIESIMDAVGLFSWRFTKRLREGSYRADRQYAFDQRNHTVVYKDSTYTVPPFVQDAISTFYYVRTQPLEVGKTVAVDAFVDGRQLKMEVRVLRKERITVQAGTFDCVVVEPMTEAVGVFKHEGRLKVWLTDDRVHMPVMMKSKLVIGSITVQLTSFQLGELADL